MPVPEDLSTEDLFQHVREHPELARAIGDLDPRARLMDELYSDPEAKKDIQRHGKRLHPKASVPDIDIPAEIQTSLKADREKITALENELKDIKMGDRRKAFRVSLLDAGAEATDLDAIEQFMVDNEIGPKSVKTAVRAFYETRDTAEPNFTPESAFTMPDGGGAAHIKALLEAGPGDDLDDINSPFVEKIVKEEFGGGSRSRRPAMA